MVRIKNHGRSVSVIIGAGLVILTGIFLSQCRAAEKKSTKPAATSRPAIRPAKIGRVRFIRLKHAGKGWDVNMGHGFDYNLLLKFKEITSIPIADNTEFKEISRLARFRPGKAPPFVYMTGRGKIPLSSVEKKILRNYCLVEGGMILADSAGGHFDRSFVAMCKQLFPDKKLVTVPNDDPLYTEPFTFPKGAPLLWHHTNKRPQGIKHNGAWVVYYHSGDMGDAWKTGHSGASKVLADRAYKLGINIMYYTFTQYLNKHHPGPTTRPTTKPARPTSMPHRKPLPEKTGTSLDAIDKL
ncbi:MAG: DUF4159 domain-containing protein [Phycisphaerales bacterium]|jgi:hypothetical protein|nr:DUF4159 domain-containing protein [Phycisphaerales bacterium]